MSSGPVDLAKRAVRRMASMFGLAVYRRRGMPFGFDLCWDIKRLSECWSRNVEVILDVGANAGQAALLFAREFPQATVFSFEPTPTTFAELRERTGHVDRIRPQNVALGPEVGRFDLHVHAGHSTLNSLVPNTRYGIRFGAQSEVIEVPATTLDQFCDEHGIGRIDLLKIDTEGYDVPVLVGSQRMLTQRRIGYILIEFNDVSPCSGASGGSLREITDFLSPHGFHFVSSHTDYVVTEGDFFAVHNALLACR